MKNELGDAVPAAAVDLTAQRREVARLRVEAIEARRLASIESTRQSERRAVFGDIHRELAALNLQQQDPELGISVLPEVVVAPDASVILGDTVNQEDLVRIVREQEEEDDRELAASLTQERENVSAPIPSRTERLLPPEDDFSFGYGCSEILAQQLQHDESVILGTVNQEDLLRIVREQEEEEELFALQLQENLDLESALRLSREPLTEKVTEKVTEPVSETDELRLTVITPAVVSVTSSAVPVINPPAAPVKVNYSFMMAAMAHPAMKAVAAVIFVASLLFLGLGLTAGLAFVPITIGLMLASVGLFAGATLFAGQNRASKLKEEELSDTVAPLAGV